MNDTKFSPKKLGISDPNWKQTPPAVRTVVASISTLQAENAKRKEQLELNLSTSSKLPSSDKRGNKPEKKDKPSSGKKRGG